MKTKYLKCLLITMMAVPTAAFAEVKKPEVKKCLLDNGIVVHGSKRQLLVCEKNKPIYQFKVAIGTNGLGKQKRGDRKTPIGLYTLGQPRKSDKFGIFIPIKYPTLAQRMNGFTGTHVGIHGPQWKIRSLTELNTSRDWTQGCIALGNEQIIKTISQWVATHPNTRVLITA
jgi:murein L,D-transpeptidase YafK